MSEKMMIYTHPTCSTCRNVLKWIDAQDYQYELVDIRQTQPSKEWFERLLNSGVQRSAILNTSGELYKKLQLKHKLPEMTNESLANLLSCEGMLIKRPIICYNDKVTFGSNLKKLEENWRKQ